jgi:hypothetical protein
VLERESYFPRLFSLIGQEQYERSYLIKHTSETYGNVYFAFHEMEGNGITKGFLGLANDYHFHDTVVQLVTFLVETVK